MLAKSPVIFIVHFIILVKCCDCKKYHNYTLFRGIPVTETDLHFYRNLSHYYEINYWRPPGLVYKPVEFTIRPQDKSNFLNAANAQGVYFKTIIEDVQKAFDKQTVKSYIRRKTDSFDWRNYFRLDDIYDWLRDLKKMYPHDIQLQNIGRTHEHRDILAVKVLLKGSKVRSRVIIEGGIHAREWISPAFVTYMIYQILHAPDSPDRTLRNIAGTYEWWFIPILNPDGYEFSHTQDRMWRKNRHNYGVDLNRNFGIAFGTVGVKFEKYEETYCGENAFSERETNAMGNFIRSKSDTLEYYISFHSYGQYIILPYAYSNLHLDNYDDMKNICLEVANRISRRYDAQYSIGTAFETVGYLTSGSSCSWVKKMFRIPYVATFELRDEGFHGFALPPEMILPTCEETMDGLITLLTPRTEKYTKLRELVVPDKQCRSFVNVFLVFFYVIILIILYFQ